MRGSCTCTVVPPGPVWIYLISRTLTQGRRAGYFSLVGVMAGVLVHLFAAALGLSALLLALPAAPSILFRDEADWSVLAGRFQNPVAPSAFWAGMDAVIK